MKKKKGEIQQFMIQMIGIIFSFAILLYATYYLSTIIIYNNVNQTARKYILKMEKQGYLDSIDKLDIISELEDDKITKVEVIVNSEGVSEKVNYGEEIRIEIQCTINQKTIDFSNFTLKTVEEEKSIIVTKSSTAKW